MFEVSLTRLILPFVTLSQLLFVKLVVVHLRAFRFARRGSLVWRMPSNLAYRSTLFIFRRRHHDAYGRYSIDARDCRIWLALSRNRQH